jgi:biotin carboxyl carrier protein
MKLTTFIDGKERSLELDGSGNSGAQRFAVDSQPAEADVAEVEPGVYSIVVEDRSFEVTIDEEEDGYLVTVNGLSYRISVHDPRRRSAGGAGLRAEGTSRITSPMPGRVVRVKVKVGDQVEAGEGLVVVEAMKMQNELKAPKAGQVTALEVAEGSSVGAGEVLAVIE